MCATVSRTGKRPSAWSLEFPKLNLLKSLAPLQMGLIALLLSRMFMPSSRTVAMLTRLCRRLLSRGHSNRFVRIDALGVLSTAALLCQAEFNDKAELIFSSFDFDEDGAISKDELVS